jgi:hypothetical protein
MNESTTADEVRSELEKLETYYKNRRKKLRALLAVLEDEEGGETDGTE